MTAILALDATSQSCSAALQFEGNVLTRVSSEERSHAKHLLPFVENLLRDASANLNQLDAIACAIGPGSFTGLRIAFSFAQGLAYALDKPLLGIHSLEAMASSVACSNAVHLPLFDARMNEVYWSAFAERQPLSTKPALLGQQSTFESQLTELLAGREAIVIGPDWESVPFAKSAANNLNLTFDPTATLSARDVLRLANDAYQKGIRSEPNEVSLCYCRDSVAWNKRTPIRPR